MTLHAALSILAAWITLAALCCAVPARFRRHAPVVDPEPFEDDYPTAPIPAVPPPPAPSRHYTDDDFFWLTDEPVDVWLTDEHVDRLFGDIVAIEGIQ